MSDNWYCEEVGLNIPELKRITEFFDLYCEDSTINFVNNYPDKKTVYIDFRSVIKFSLGLEQAIINKYSKIEPVLKSALMGAKMIMWSNKDITPKDIELQITNLPPHYKKGIRDIRKKDIGKIVCVDGFIKSRSQTRPKILKAAFKCLRCGHINFVTQNSRKLEEPFIGCENETCGKKGPFDIVIEESELTDFQVMKLQEMPDSMIGTKPYDIALEFKGDLTGLIEAGEKVTVIGLVKSRLATTKEGKTCQLETFIDVMSAEKAESDYSECVITPEDKEAIIKLSQREDIRDLIIRSIAPSVYGYEEIKEGIALQLFTGVRKVLPDGTILRGNINVLLVGDPSTAKSQLLRKAVTLSTRGVFASGRNASAAGLTAAVVNDELGEGWTLEGGAAVMAAGGLLSIDEIGQAEERELSALHEIMEQGTLSVSKAGIVATLKADCSVLAAGNPKKGYFDKYGDEPLPKQIGIPPALWTRFDLIFTVYDIPNMSYDNAISEHIMNSHRIGAIIQNRDNAENSEYTEADIQAGSREAEAPISKELLKKYIVYARANIFPVAPAEVASRIKGFYNELRQLKPQDSNRPPVTARTLEAIQRLSEASARIRLSNKVTLEDFETAKKLIEKSLRDIGLDENNKLDVNLLNGLNSYAQIDKVRSAKNLIRNGKTEQEVIETLERDKKIDPNHTKSLINHLLDKRELMRTPEGGLKVIA